MAEEEERADYARFDGVVMAALREAENALVVYARDLDARLVAQGQAVITR